MFHISEERQNKEMHSVNGLNAYEYIVQFNSEHSGLRHFLFFMMLCLYHCSSQHTSDAVPLLSLRDRR